MQEVSPLIKTVGSVVRIEVMEVDQGAQAYGHLQASGCHASDREAFCHGRDERVVHIQRAKNEVSYLLVGKCCFVDMQKFR